MPLVETVSLLSLLALGWSWFAVDILSRVFGRNLGRLDVRVTDTSATSRQAVADVLDA